MTLIVRSEHPHRKHIEKNQKKSVFNKLKVEE